MSIKIRVLFRNTVTFPLTYNSAFGMFELLNPIISSSYQRNRQEFLGRGKALVWITYLAGGAQAIRHVKTGNHIDKGIMI